jgi:rhamnulose-1-phosphate aldolase/alcohol dehydrogenase
MQEVVTCSGPVAIEFGIPPNRWSDADAAGKSPQELLLYRSNLLGGDQRVTNFGGGNTSAKIQEQDPLTGETVSVLWVKGSGGDIGSMGLDGFATLYLNEVLSTERLYRGKEFEDEMVGYLPHCAFNLNARAASIDTPLHAFLPHAHVDHVHPDAVIALAACKRGEEITEEVWGGEVGWLPWIRPGFELGFRLRDYATLNPDARGVVLAGHGIICWGDNARSCYENTIDLTAEAARYLNARLTGRSAFGGPVVAPLDHEARAAAAAKLMPKLRAFMGGEVRKVGHFLDGPEVLEFAGSRDFLRLSGLGTSCPDHFLRTKIKPLALNELKLDDDEYLREPLEEYRESYTAYYERCAQLGDPRMRDPNPIVFLIPGVGLITFAAEKAEARLASEFYCNAINVMRGAEAVGGYVGLPEQEAFKVEYWALEEAKLQRLPEPKPLAGKVAVVSGGAGGIGSATARRLL